MPESVFVDIDMYQITKRGQNICGDAFITRKIAEEQRAIAVLSDGLGSGVKASILANMTASMAMKFVAGNMEFLHSAEIMMEALPICQVRKISYATFTIVDCRASGEAHIIEMGNPGCLCMRGSRPLELESRLMESPRWEKRTMRFSRLHTRPGDRIIFFSDGITQAGMGTDAFKLGWRREGCRDFIAGALASSPHMSSRKLAREIVGEALRKEPATVAGDDMSCGVFYFRHPRALVLLTGPPFDRGSDRRFVDMLRDARGRKVVCGGTTAGIVARELGVLIETPLPRARTDIPPVSRVAGVDLATEGILTLTRAAQYLEQGRPADHSNAAADLVELFLESDIIHFVVGTRINEAHQDPTLPVDLEIRRNIVKRIAALLEHRYLKEVRIQYI
ncbi:MAG: serine/threonine protein phosphatase [Deltaproteobacteria bacterium]|nr:serine/threonine protein phosphatase [Deltaproteobacteria bacterium]